jgi:ribosomal protein L31
MKSKSPTRKLSKSRKKASGRKRSGSKRSGSKKASRRKRSGRSASRKSSRRKSSRRKRSGRSASRKSSRKQKNVNIDVIFYGQPYYNAVMKGDFTKINKHINEFNKLFKRKIGQSGPYGEHVIYSINPVETNKFKKKAREIFGKLKLHVSFNTSKSLKYLDKPSSR